MAYINYQTRKEISEELNKQFKSEFEKYGIYSVYFYNGVIGVDSTNTVPDEVFEEIQNWMYNNVTCTQL